LCHLLSIPSPKATKDARYKEEDFQQNQLVTEIAFITKVHTECDDEQIKYITDSILEFFRM
jgi:hypothetical protein